MRFGVLGPVEAVTADGAPVELGGPQPRKLLALLLLGAGRPLPAETLADAIWGDRLPSGYQGTLQTYVSRLRRALPDHPVAREAGGYRLTVEPEAVDAWRFEQLADEGRRALDAEDPARARELLREAESLWRGPALVEIRDLDVAIGAAIRLEERLLGVREDRIEAELRLGRHDALVGELAERAAQHPLRERLRAQLALALYRSGRQAEALRAIAEARRTLAEELGLEPGPELRELEAAVLRHDPALAPPSGPRPSGARPSGALPSTLVGRDAELDVLVGLLDQAGTGPRLAVVEGEPGIGKTRLVEELGELAAARGALVCWGRGHEAGAAPAFWPWSAVLRELVTAVPDARSAPLDVLLGESGGDTSLARFELHRAVADALRVAAAARGTVVVVLDDLQWADDASLELLGHLAGSVRTAGLLVVATVRELEVGRGGALVDALAAVARSPGSRRFRLAGLSAAAVAALVEAELGAAPGAAELATIRDRSEGNPFFAVELARLLAGGSAEPGAVPAGVRDVVRQRLARLPDATREVLQVAALMGREIDVPVLRCASGDRVAVLDDLEPALVQRLLVDDLDRPGVFAFGHALIREVLADDLTGLQRARLHLRIADALDTCRGADDCPEIYAEHLAAATVLGTGERAAAALERAADVAIRRSAYDAAADALRRAAELRRAAGSSPAQQSAELDAVASLFFVERVVRGHAAAVAGPAMARARELATQTGRSEVLARLLWAEWVGADKALEHARSEALVRELEAIAAGTTDEAVRGLALHARGVRHWHAGELKEALAALDEAARRNRSWVGERLRIDALTAPLRPSEWPLGHPVIPFVHQLVGDLPDATAVFEEMLEVERHPFATTVIWMFAAFGALATGDLDAAVLFGSRGVEADPEMTFSYWGPGSQLALGSALAARGQLDEGLVLVERALPVYLGSGTRIFVPLVQARVAEGLVIAGRLEAAAEQLAEADAATAALQQRWVEPVLAGVAARLAGARGAPASEVADRLEAAAAMAEAQGAGAVAADLRARRTGA